MDSWKETDISFNCRYLIEIKVQFNNLKAGSAVNFEWNEKQLSGTTDNRGTFGRQ